jgi:hypothetical protein
MITKAIMYILKKEEGENKGLISNKYLLKMNEFPIFLREK